MRRFIAKTTLYSILAFTFGAIMDKAVCSGLLRMEDYRFQDYAAMMRGGMNNDILIMGDSRGKSHYDPAIIDSLKNASSFCIGVGGYPLPVQLMKYHLYLEHNKKPSTIIQDIDYSCFREFDDVRHQHQSEQFFPLVYDPLMRRELKGLGYGFCELDIPMYRMYGYQQVIKNGLLEALRLKHYVSRPAFKGHRPEEGQWNGEELRNKGIDTIRPNGSNVKLFEDYLNQCKADTTQVVLVYSPMYYEARDKFIGLDSLRTYFGSLAGRLGMKYLDYLDTPITLDSNNFCVAVHMNPKATKEFTELLCSDLD